MTVPAALAGGSGPIALAAAPRDPDDLAVLTLRQREVLALMAEGLSNAAIARRLFVTEKAVVQHCSNIYAALDLPPTPDEHRRVLAVLRHVDFQHRLHRPDRRGQRLNSGDADPLVLPKAS